MSKYLWLLPFFLTFPVATAQADGPTVTCEASAGRCQVNAFYDFGTYTETELVAAPADGDTFLLTTLFYPDDRALTVDWQSPNGGNCEQALQCENGEVIDCFREAPCWSGENGFSVHCGMYLPIQGQWMPDPSLEATVKTCRGLSEPWPDLPPPTPKPPIKKKPKPGPGGGGKGGGQPPPSGVCDRKAIIAANTTLIDYHETIHVKTTKRRPGSSLPGNFDSQIDVRHDAPSSTHIVAEVYIDKGPERHEVVHLDDTMYWKTPTGSWLEIDRTGMAGKALRPPDPAVADHDKYGPRGLVEDIEPGNFEYVATGPCEGILDRDTCHAFRFLEDGFENIAYFSTDNCLLRSVVGENEEGPRSFVFTYGEQTVGRPSGEIHQLTGDPAKDMPLMMRLMGQGPPP